MARLKLHERETRGETIIRHRYRDAEDAPPPSDIKKKKKRKREEKEGEDQRRDREERSRGSKWSDRIRVAAILVAGGSD